jgi:hypothetical protein
MNDLLAQLHAADPTPDGIGYPADQVASNIDSIRRSDDAANPVRAPRTVPRARRIVIVALAVATVGGAAFAADVVTWPWSRGATESMAYGITRHADGSVDVLIKWGEVKDPAALQAQLRAAGIPVVVLVESPTGTCHEPPQEGTMAGYAAINTIPRSTAEQRDEGFVIRPSLLPPGSTIVIGLPFPGEPLSYGRGFVNMHVTDQTPPTCIPQSITRGIPPGVLPTPIAPVPSHG